MQAVSLWRTDKKGLMHPVGKHEAEKRLSAGLAVYELSDGLLRRIESLPCCSQ